MNCECGCGLPAPIASHTSKQYGRVKGQPARFINGHNSRLRNPGYSIDAVSGCWNWNGALNKHGYGVTGRTVHGIVKTTTTHRVFYTQAKGPIPEGMHLDHLCRNRRCVNPDHLEPVTAKENVARSARCRSKGQTDEHKRRLSE